MSYRINAVIYTKSQYQVPRYVNILSSDPSDNSHFFYTNTLYIIDAGSSKRLVDKIRVYARNPVIALIGGETDIYNDCDIYERNVKDVFSLVNTDFQHLKIRIPGNMSSQIKEIEESTEDILDSSNYSKEDISILESLNLVYDYKGKLYRNIKALSEDFFSENRKDYVEGIMILHDIAFRLDGNFVLPFCEEKSKKMLHGIPPIEIQNVPYHIFNKLMCRLSKHINNDFKKDYFSLLNCEVHYKNEKLLIYVKTDDIPPIAGVLLHIFCLCKLHRVKDFEILTERANPEIKLLVDQLKNGKVIEEVLGFRKDLDETFGINPWIVSKVLLDGEKKERYFRYFLSLDIDFLVDNNKFVMVSESVQEMRKNERFETFVDHFFQFDKLFNDAPVPIPTHIGTQKILKFEWVGFKSYENYTEGCEPYIDLEGVKRFYYPGTAIGNGTVSSPVLETNNGVTSENFLCVNVIGGSHAGKTALINKLLGSEYVPMHVFNMTFRVAFSSLKEGNTEILFTDSLSGIGVETMNKVFYRDGDLFAIGHDRISDNEGYRLRSTLKQIRKRYPSSEIIVYSSHHEYKTNEYYIYQGIPNILKEFKIKNFFPLDSETGYGIEEFKSFLIKKATDSTRSFPSSFIGLEKKIKEMDVFYITKEDFSNIVGNAEIEERFAKYLIERKVIRDEGDVYIKNIKLSEYFNRFYKLTDKQLDSTFAYSKDDLKALFPETEDIRILRNFMVKYEIGFYRDRVLYLPFKMSSFWKSLRKNLEKKISEDTGITVNEDKKITFMLNNTNPYTVVYELACRLSRYLNLSVLKSNLLAFEINFCDFVIFVEESDVHGELVVYYLNQNYEVISYVLQVIRAVLSGDRFYSHIILDNESLRVDVIQEGNQLIDCATTFFYSGLNDGKMTISDDHSKREVNLDFVNALSNYKELFPSGKVLYLMSDEGMKIPVSKKENFFEKWEILNDLAEPYTDEEWQSAELVSSKMAPILFGVIEGIPNKYFYTRYMFGNYREEFTEYKNDFNRIDLIRYKTVEEETRAEMTGIIDTPEKFTEFSKTVDYSSSKGKKLIRVNFVAGIQTGKTTIVRKLTGGVHTKNSMTNQIKFYTMENGEKEVLISDVNSSYTHRPVNDLFYQNGDLFVIFGDRNPENSSDEDIDLNYKEIKAQFPLSPIALCIPEINRGSGINHDLGTKHILSIAKKLGINDIFTVNSKTNVGIEEFRDFLYSQTSAINERVPPVFETLYRKLKEVNFLYMSKEEFGSMLKHVKGKDKFIEYLLHRSFILEEGNNYINGKTLAKNLESLFTFVPTRKLTKRILTDEDLESLWNTNIGETEVMKDLIRKYELGFFRDGNLYIEGGIPYEHFELRNDYVVEDISEVLKIDIHYENYFEIVGTSSFRWEIQRKFLSRVSEYINLEISSERLIVLDIQNDRFAVYFGNSKFYIVPFQPSYSNISMILQVFKNIFDSIGCDGGIKIHMDYREIPASNLFESIGKKNEKNSKFYDQQLIDSTICFFYKSSTRHSIVIKYNNEEREVFLSDESIKYLKNKRLN